MNRLLACLAIATGCSAAAPSSLPSHVPPRVAAAVALGRVAADEPIDFAIALKLRDRAALTGRLAAMAAPGAALAAMTPTSFGDAYGPVAGDYARLLEWLRGHGLTVDETASRTLVRVHGRAADVEAALGTELRLYQDAHGQFRAPTELAPDPAIAGTIAAAAGLDTAQRWVPLLRSLTPVSPQVTGGSEDPSDLQALYNTTGAGVGQGDGETIAIVGAGTPPDPANDVDGYIKKYTLDVPNRAAQYAQYFIGGPNRDPISQASQEYGENILDIDMVLAMAPHANIIHVITATNGGLLFDGFGFVVNNLPQAHQASFSFGFCERGAASEDVLIDNLLSQAAAQRQQFFVASGDRGNDACGGGAGNPVLSVSSPATSPYVFAVGGTQLVFNTGGQVTGEAAWSDSAGATGGGQSEFIAKPAYQQPHMGDTFNPRTPVDGVRDIPDVAALGGPPGINTYGQGQLSAAEGTSAAAPMWAGMWALLDEAHGHQGIANGADRIYELGAHASSGFHDITTGSDMVPGPTAYTAGPGWDFTTGWGTPNLANLNAQW
jgi:kumamolisin